MPSRAHGEAQDMQGPCHQGRPGPELAGLGWPSATATLSCAERRFAGGQRRTRARRPSATATLSCAERRFAGGRRRTRARRGHRRSGGARPGWLRALAVSSSAAWLPKRPAGVGPPEPLPPLQLDLDVPDGKFINKPYSYSIDLNLATRMTRAYDVGTFTVVPLIWNCGAGLDQDKVEKIRCHPCSSTSMFQTASSSTSRTPTRST